MSPVGNSPFSGKGAAPPIQQKGTWWTEDHEVHAATIEGPYPNGDRFAVRFKYHVTRKASGERFQMDEVSPALGALG